MFRAHRFPQLTRSCLPAAQIVHEALEKPRNIHFKGVTDLVTDTDRASEEAILEASHTISPCCMHDTCSANAQRHPGSSAASARTCLSW